MTQTVEQLDYRWYYAFCLDVALTVAYAGTVVTNPGLIPIAGLIAAAIGSALIGAYILARRGDLCAFFGHDWSRETPWDSEDLAHRPFCERCGDIPDGYVVTDSAEEEK